ncbi:hypothetical protein ZOSMA_22G00720 [Zostera marina]|uniref:C2H2-type domain-containing protein n=1 Tax=Zostera marina TaxID=29655 RepID=A0A0K9PKM1_ZOSMR|nr:hypothetical protein ZOSMA_22G00720 [Zostera marina]
MEDSQEIAVTAIVVRDPAKDHKRKRSDFEKDAEISPAASSLESDTVFSMEVELNASVLKGGSQDPMMRQKIVAESSESADSELLEEVQENEVYFEGTTTISADSKMINSKKNRSHVWEAEKDSNGGDGKHKQSFRDIRRYYCEYCGVCRSKKTLITAHVLSNHKEKIQNKTNDVRDANHGSGGRGYTCVECNAIFTKPAYLKQHMQRHSIQIILNHYTV